MRAKYFGLIGVLCLALMPSHPSLAMGFQSHTTTSGTPQPDLVIESVSIFPPNPEPNQQATYTVRVRNQGTANVSSTFWVSLFVDNIPLGDCMEFGDEYWLENALNAGAYLDLSTTIALPTGPHTLYAYADTRCYISESVEFNNIRGPIIVYIGIHANTFYSNAAHDGWILESFETSNSGGTMNAILTTLRLGDSLAKKQYRSLLSFNTGSLPDNAVIITKVTLKLRQQGIVGGGNPITAFQGIMVDLRKGSFGTASLQLTDWQAAAGATIGPFTPTLVSGWYTLDLTSAKAYINKLATGGGLTQIRLRFQLDDNNNTISNYLSLYSGNAGEASRPQLIVEYYVP